MVVASKPKKGTGTGPGRPRTAKAPAGPWTEGTFMLRGNGKILMERTVTYKQSAMIWTELPKLIAKGGPGKYTFTIETTTT